MQTVLFVCIENSARSQMAQAFANRFGKGIICAYSAGFRRGKLNPHVIDAMKELGYDLRASTSQSLFDDDFIAFAQEHPFDYVVTLCDEASAQRCPVFPSTGKPMHWRFPDPASFSVANKTLLMAQVRDVRDGIEERVRTWIESLRETPLAALR